jgi:hypothetical protein
LLTHVATEAGPTLAHADGKAFSRNVTLPTGSPLSVSVEE